MGISKMKHLATFTLAIFVVSCCIVLGLAGCSAGEEPSETSSNVDEKYANLEPVTLILADSTGKGAAGNLWGEEIAKNATEITGGKLTVDYHPNGELGGDVDLLRQEQSNDIQMVITQPATMVSFIPDIAVFDLPMAFATYDADQIETVLNGDNEFTQGLQSSFEESGFYDLGWLQDGTYRETTSNKDLSTINDFKGFQVRTMENPNHMAFWSALGAEPTPLAFAEVYFALQNGTVDGQENAIDTCVGSSFQEVQKYLAMTNHILYANNISINKECWDGLDPAYQDALNEAIAKATETIRPQITQLEEENLQVMRDAGVEVIEYDEAFFNEVLNNSSVKELYADIDEQTGGLSTIMVNELEKVKE